MIYGCSESSDLTNLIKVQSFSGTTDVGGDIYLGTTISDRIIIAVHVTNMSVLATPKAISNRSWYATIQKYNSDTGLLELQKNVSITSAKYYYIEI